MFGATTVWLLAACVLLFLTAFPALVIFFCSLCVARRKDDPCRNWLVWFRVGFILFAAANFFLFLVYLFAALFADLYSSSTGHVTSKAILPVQVELDLIGTLIASFCEISIIFALSGLDQGIIIAHTTELSRGDGEVLAGTVQLADKIFHFCVYGLGGVLAVLSITAFSLGQHLYLAYGLANSRIGYDHSYVGLSYSQDHLGRTSKLLSLAAYVIILVVVAFITVKSIITIVRCRGDKRVKMASTYLIVCDSLFLLRGIYNVSYAVAFRLRNTGSLDKLPSVFTVVDVIVDTWPAFIILCILFALGCKKRGLWSTKQPLAPGLLEDTPRETPGGGSYNTSQPSDVGMGSNMQEPQVHEMLQVAAQGDQPHVQMPMHQIPRRPVNAPQLQVRQQQIQDTMTVDGEDDSPPDYYSARHQTTLPQHQPHPILPLQATFESGQIQAGPSFAMAAQQGFHDMIIPGSPPTHDDAMGLYHQADGRIPQSEALPYNEKPSA